MKRILLLLFLFVSLAASAATQIGSLYYTLNSSNKTAEVEESRGTKYSGNISIPSSVTYSGTTYKVTSIGSWAFDGCSGLTSITIPSSVTSIGFKSFAGCSGLTSITIPSSVTSIDFNSFAGCSGLTSVTIPNSVTSIGSYAFSGCSGLTSLTIPSSVTSIGDGAFKGCEGLTKAEFGSIESLCKMKFEDNSSNPLYYAHHLFIGGKEISDLIIPSSVTSIGSYAFYGCSGLTSVTIPNSVTSIGSYAFDGCSGLTSVTIPNSVTNIGPYAFQDCNSLPIIDNIRYADTYLVEVVNKSITTCEIKAGTRYIGEYAFDGCSGLTSITIPSSVTSIGNHAFYNCSGLTSLTIPSSVTSIGSSAFCGCSGLTSITIPSSVTSIGDHTFWGCSGLTSLTIPSSVTSIGSWAFYGCKCSPLYFMGIPESVDTGAFAFFEGDVLAPSDFRSKATNIGLSSSKFFASEGNDWGMHIKSLLCGVTFYEPFVESVLKFKDIKFFLFDVDGTQLSYTKTDDGHYTIKGLKIGTDYNVKVTYTDVEGLSKSCEFACSTKTPSPYIYRSNYSSTQSSVIIEEVSDISDDTCTPEKVGVLYNGVEYTNFPVVIDGLYPGQSITVYPFAYYDGIRFDGKNNISASGITLSINNQDISYASSVLLYCSYTKGDAQITEEEISVNGKTYSGNTVTVTGLDPDTKYKATYSLKANGKWFSEFVSFTTPGLTLKTMQPKVISAGNVIVAAEANLDEAETNVGFEWRRTDWTDDFASNTGGAYIYGGQMEGYIRNLYTEKLWKYRPYYLSDNGKYYYGDWVGLDPTNTSYFEATVHTYNQITVEGNTALVKGYALRGTDDIKVQGFVYWKKVAGAKAQDGRMYAASVPINAKTVEAKGQVMTATLPDLDYSSEYCYMAFVTTSAGDTYYGEEMTFATGEDPTGISDVMSDNASSEPATVMGYYDLNGRRIQTPQSGIYIIRYSDGSSRKFMKK